VVHEPVAQWQHVPTVGGGAINLLDCFYADPPKYAYTFQNFVFMSRVMQVGDSQLAIPVAALSVSAAAAVCLTLLQLHS